MRTLLMVQLGCTLAMTGIIWFVQVVHYPLFLRVGPESFVAYETEHATRTGWVVGPLMCAELATACLMLVTRFRPRAVPFAQAVLGVALVGIVWISTGLIQVPLHNRLAEGYEAAAIELLVVTNWIRTVAWTGRAALVLWWMARLIKL